MDHQATIFAEQSEPTANAGRATRFGWTTYALIFILLSVSATVGFNEWALLLAAAVLCGWCEVDGLCGTSHVLAITPLQKLERKLWATAAAAYLFSGLATASVVGAMVGVVGLIGSTFETPLLWLSVALSGLLIARELGIVAFDLPQVHRQTISMWRIEYGMIGGAAMWGAHIVLTFATVIRHGGLSSSR